MSLHEVYSLAHTAQCRLNLAASRPDRNLRFVVGHLMHYESLRLRIVEIEHDNSRSRQSGTVQFSGTGNVDHRLQHKPSGLFVRKSPPPPPVDVDYEDEDEDDSEDDMIYDDEEGDELSLQRFPSASSKPAQAPPELEPDDPNENDSDDDEPTTPEDPDQATLESVLKGNGNDALAKIYQSVRNCPCHGKTNAPTIERIWELPDKEGPKGKTRAVAEVTVTEIALTAT